MDLTRVASLKTFLVFFILTLSNEIWAYPELIRHGYVSCAACHVTSQGGGLLNSYGKELSKELLSRNDSPFRDANQEKRLLEIKSPDWLQMGGQTRFLQTFSESSVASKGRFMVMQVEFESLARWSEEVSFYSSVGRFEATKPEAEWKDFVYLPELWIRYQKNEGPRTWGLRAGRFYPVYGLWLSEHTLVNRKYLGLNPGEERLAIELSYLNENFQLFVTGLQARAQNGRMDPEKGYTAQLSRVYGSKSRVGVNLYRSKLEQSGNEVEKSHEGLFALVGWTEKLAMLFQIDQIHNSDGKIGALDLLKFSWEAAQGVEVSFTQEYYNTDTQRSDPRFEAYGVGVQYFPFPNFDFYAAFREQKDSSQLNEFQKVVWLIGHFYL